MYDKPGRPEAKHEFSDLIERLVSELSAVSPLKAAQILADVREILINKIACRRGEAEKFIEQCNEEINILRQ